MYGGDNLVPPMTCQVTREQRGSAVLPHTLHGRDWSPSPIREATVTDPMAPQRPAVVAGDTGWIYPETHALQGFPSGVALFISVVHGPAFPQRMDTGQIWVSGFVYDPSIGDWRLNPMALVISRFGRRAAWASRPRRRSRRHVAAAPKIRRLSRATKVGTIPGSSDGRDRDRSRQGRQEARRRQDRLVSGLFCSTGTQPGEGALRSSSCCRHDQPKPAS